MDLEKPEDPKHDQDKVSTAEISNSELTQNKLCFEETDLPNTPPIAVECFKSIQRKKRYLMLYSHCLIQSDTDPALLPKSSTQITHSCPSNNPPPTIRTLPFNFDFAFYVKYGREQNRKYSAIKFMRLSNRASETYYIDSEKTMAKWVTLLTPYLNQMGIQEYYRTVKSLGKGVSGEVFLADRISDGKQFAIKTFSKIKNSQKCRDAFENEIKIMRLLNHPNIIKLYGVFVSTEYLYAVLDYLPGGTLYEEIKAVQKQRQYYSKEEQFIIIQGLVMALEHLRIKRIVHRDLKLQNILIKPATAENPYRTYVLCDFGLSTWLDEENYIFEKCGTPGYIAPEILRTPKNQRLLIDCKVDVFSLGCIAHLVMLSRPVFHFNGDCKYLLKQNKACQIDFRLDRYKLLDPLQIQLLRGLLDDNPTKRMSTAEVLKHQYFVSNKHIILEKKIQATQAQVSRREVGESRGRQNSFLSRDEPKDSSIKEGAQNSRRVLRSTQRLGSVEVKEEKKTGFSRNPSLNKEIQFKKDQEEAKSSILDYFFKKKSDSKHQSTKSMLLQTMENKKPVSSTTLITNNNLVSMKLKDSTESKKQIFRQMMGS